MIRRRICRTQKVSRVPQDQNWHRVRVNRRDQSGDLFRPGIFRGFDGLSGGRTSQVKWSVEGRHAEEILSRTSVRQAPN